MSLPDVSKRQKKAMASLVTYSLDSDILRIQLAQAPYEESEEVLDGVVIDFDKHGKILAIEIEGARERANLEQIVGNEEVIVDESGPPVQIYTVRELATELQVSPRTLQKTIQTMRTEGHDVGINRGRTVTTILSESDAARIRRWRRAHKPGRPRVRQT